MKNAQSSSSFDSFESDYYYNNETSAFSTRKSMVPIRELDFESRLMLNFKIPKRKSYSEQMRKNDYVIDLVSHNQNNFLNTNQNTSNLNTESMKSCFNSVNSDIEDIEYESTKDNNKRKLKNFRRYSHHHHHSAPHSNGRQSQHQQPAQQPIQNVPIKLNKNDSFRNRLKSQSDNLTTSNKPNNQTTIYTNQNNNASQELYTDFKTVETSKHELEEDSIDSNDFNNSCNLKLDLS